MSINKINRSNDEEIIGLLRTILDNGTGKAETHNEHILIKLMQIRNTPIVNMEYDQERVEFCYNMWLEDSGYKSEKKVKTECPKLNGILCPECDKEMYDKDGTVLYSSPLQKRVICLGCGHNDYRIYE